MLFFSDTPEVDVVGTNLYQRYLNRLHARRNNQSETTGDCKDVERVDPELPESRNIPPGAVLRKSTVGECFSVLVCTGVHRPGQQLGEDAAEKHYKGHRDFPANPSLQKPKKLCTDVEEALQFILDREGVCFQ